MTGDDDCQGPTQVCENGATVAREEYDTPMDVDMTFQRRDCPLNVKKEIPNDEYSTVTDVEMADESEATSTESLPAPQEQSTFVGVRSSAGRGTSQWASPTARRRFDNSSPASRRKRALKHASMTDLLQALCYKVNANKPLPPAALSKELASETSLDQQRLEKFLAACMAKANAARPATRLSTPCAAHSLPAADENKLCQPTR